MSIKKISLLGAGVGLLGIAGIQQAVSYPTPGTEVLPVRPRVLRVEYECEFHEEDISCEAEGRIKFAAGNSGAVSEARNHNEASLNLDCFSKKSRFSIRDRRAVADRRRDDLEITGRDNRMHATVVLEDFFDELTAMNDDLDAKLEIKGRTLHGFCEIDKEHDNGHSDGGDNGDTSELLLGSSDGGPANSGQNSDDEGPANSGQNSDDEGPANSGQNSDDEGPANSGQNSDD